MSNDSERSAEEWALFAERWLSDDSAGSCSAPDRHTDLEGWPGGCCQGCAGKAMATAIAQAEARGRRAGRTALRLKMCDLVEYLIDLEEDGIKSYSAVNALRLGREVRDALATDDGWVDGGTAYRDSSGPGEVVLNGKLLATDEQGTLDDLAELPDPDVSNEPEGGGSIRG